MSDLQSTLDPFQEYTTWTSTDVWIAVYWLFLVVTVGVFMLQIISIMYNSSRLRAQNRERVSTITRSSGISSSQLLIYSMFGTYIACIAGLIATLARLNAWPTCSSCNKAYVLVFFFYISAKTCNYFFFLQRARLAQGMEMNQLCFDKVMPCVLIAVFLLYISLISVWPIPGTCVQSPTSGRWLCVWDDDDVEIYHQAAFGLQVVVDLCATVFFLWLFGKPLCNIMKVQSKNKTKNDKQAKDSERKMHRTIQVNFIFSGLAMVSTSMFAVTWWFVPYMDWLAIADYMWNSICLFLMLASNRRLLMHMCCPFKQSRFARWLYEYSSKTKEEVTDSQYDPKRVLAELEAKAASNKEKFKHNKELTITSPSHEKSQPSQSMEASQTKNLRRSSATVSPQEMIDQHGAISPAVQSCIYYKARLFWLWFGNYFCCPKCFVCTCPSGVLLKCCGHKCEERNRLRMVRRDNKFRKLFTASDASKMWQLRRRARGSITMTVGMSGLSGNLQDRTRTRNHTGGSITAAPPPDHGARGTLTKKLTTHEEEEEYDEDGEDTRVSAVDLDQETSQVAADDESVELIVHDDDVDDGKSAATTPQKTTSVPTQDDDDPSPAHSTGAAHANNDALPSDEMTLAASMPSHPSIELDDDGDNDGDNDDHKHEGVNTMIEIQQVTQGSGDSSQTQPQTQTQAQASDNNGQLEELDEEKDHVSTVLRMKSPWEDKSAAIMYRVRSATGSLPVHDEQP